METVRTTSDQWSNEEIEDYERKGYRKVASGFSRDGTVPHRTQEAIDRIQDEDNAVLIEQHSNDGRDTLQKLFLLKK